jgi:hypothetical protein
MAIKAIEKIRGTFAKALEREPLFVLRSQDKFAAATVRHWADLAEAGGANKKKVEEARQLADDMERHARLHGGSKVPD